MAAIYKMSFSASILILTVIVLRALFMHKIPKRTFLALWGVVLCRLLVPFSIPSRFSIYTLMDSLDVTSSEQITLTPLINTTGLAQPNLNAGGTLIRTTSFTPGFSPSPYFIIWILGLVSCALFFIITHLRCRREYKTSLPVENTFVWEWQRKHTTKRLVQIRQSDKINAPLTYGIWNPVILLPKTTDYKDTQKIQYILTHEFTHIKRFDTLLKWLLAAALCVHWFNPLVWVMYLLTNRDIELSCDETVVRTFGEETKSFYAIALIGMEEKKSKITPLCNNFSKNALEERILAIMKIKKSSVTCIVLALTLAGAATTAFATSAATKNNPITAVSNTNDTLKKDETAHNKVNPVVDRYSPVGAQKEYDSLLSLKTPDYQKLSVMDFNDSLLAWANKNAKANDRILKDTAMNDRQVELTREESSFVELTFPLSTALNTIKVSHENYGDPLVNPVMQYELNTTEGESAYYKLWYQLSIQITDEKKLTIGECEQYLSNIVNGMQTYWNKKSIDELASVNEKICRKQLNTLIRKNSNQLIQFELVKMSFEGMDERKTASVD